MLVAFILEYSICPYTHVCIHCVIQLLTVCTWWFSFWTTTYMGEGAQWFKTSPLLEMHREPFSAFSISCEEC